MTEGQTSETVRVFAEPSLLKPSIHASYAERLSPGRATLVIIALSTGLWVLLAMAILALIR